jgi:hypothetical protein
MTLPPRPDSGTPRDPQLEAVLAELRDLHAELIRGTELLQAILEAQQQTRDEVVRGLLA